jgi:hypothetical protein
MTRAPDPLVAVLLERFGQTYAAQASLVRVSRRPAVARELKEAIRE